ncbi:MAG: hypothetical protein AB7S26_37085 [Sandaracinaceae bacterium]
MKATAIERARMVAALAALLALPACEEGEPADVRPYTDSAGRSCNVDLNDISGTAMCDVDASTLISCDGAQEPGIVTQDDFDFDTMIWTLESCTGCIDRAAHQTFIGDCANIECTLDADCLYLQYTCRGGICQHE